MKSVILFPEYGIYKIAQRKSKENRDLLLGLAALWIILKVGIVLRIIIHILSPYKLSVNDLVWFLMPLTAIVTSTGVCLRFSRHYENRKTTRKN